MMKKNVRCAVIGQHPLRFPWGFDEEDDGCRRMKLEMAQRIMELRQRGVTEFQVACDPGVGLHCPDCRDTGYVNGRRCHCFEQAAINLVYTQSNLKEILERENFSTFSFDYYSADDINPATGRSSLETAKDAVAKCHDFIDHFDSTFSNLYLYGDTGIGKTFLSNCIAKELLDRGHSVIYFTAFQLFDILSKGVFKRDEEALLSHRNIFDCDLLIIDDLGTELSNSFTTSQLFLCINERILRQKSTIISTNLGMNQLADIYSERVLSRISSNYTLLKLFGADIRILKRNR